MKFIVIASIKGQEITYSITAKNESQALKIASSELKDRQIDGDYIEAATLTMHKKGGRYHYGV